MEKEELAAQVSRALEKISEQQRIVVLAKIFDGYKFAQIAQEMNIAVATVKVHYFRALKTLSRELSPLHGSQGE